VGVKCKDGVILGAEKQVFSALLVPRTNRRIFNVDHAIGMAVAGKIPDGRHIMTYARTEASKFLKDFALPITGRTLSDRLALYLNAYTLYNAVRPFGSTEIIASYSEDEGYALYQLEPSGVYYGYTCCTAGKGRQTAKAQFEKNDFSKLTCEEALTYVAKMYLLIHSDYA
jgi:20S proteasome subunit alpha 7